MLDVAGLWPLEKRGAKFYVFLVYSTVHLCAAFADLARVFGNFDLMIENLSETALIVMVMAKVPALKYSTLMKNIVRDITTNDDDHVDNFRNETERKICISYSSQCLRLLQLALRLGWIATCAFYVKTIVYFLVAEMFGDGTTIYVLPYHVHFFVNITDIRVYILVYAYQGPMVYVITCHGIIAGFMWSLVVHVCGQLSVLAFRIKNIKATRTEKSNEQLEDTFRRIIQKHNQIIQTYQTLERIFRIFLLDEIVICAVVVGLCMYSILVLNANLADFLEFFCLVVWISGMLLATCGWCLVGDILRQESLNVHDAYYECEWYDMPLRCQKLIIICMIRARSPLFISGGGFYVYTLTSFTGVIKSAMAYASMLRQKIYERRTDFINWHRRLLDVAGLWPLEPRGIKFYTFVIYSTVHLCGAFADLAQVFGRFDLMVENLGETGLIIMVMAKIPAMKYSSLLRSVVREILASNRADDEDNYKNLAERKMYISYSAKSLRFFQLALRIGWFATGAFYVKTMVYFIIAEIYGSGTRIYAMPYHVHFFNITDIRVYILVYAYQSPMIYVITCHGIIACFMWSLIMHVCGQLSVLAFAIKHIVATCSGKSDEQLEYAFCRIIQKHNKLIRTCKALERIFRIFLLDEIAICAIVVGLCMYSILVLNSNLSDVLLLFCYIMFIFGMLMITYGWCLVGDILRQESLDVFDACYECKWYDMPPRCQKLIIICMIRAKSPLYISGGGFYIFTLTSFTGVVKSAMTYASMLRQVA